MSHDMLFLVIKLIYHNKATNGCLSTVNYATGILHCIYCCLEVGGTNYVDD
jgi:hypothetical protein